MSKLEHTASELRAWFQNLLALCDRTVFAVATHEPHKQAAVLGVLTRNAKTIVHSEVDQVGALYTPLCFTLIAACRRIGVEPGDREWLSAVKNVLRLESQLQEAARTAAWPVGTPASNFKEQLDEALINAGVTDRPTILDHHNRQLALGLAVNWGLRFLVAYALEVASPASAKSEDLDWVRQTIEHAKHAA